ncbi:hypothetical protein LGT39_05875 [Demequina sp. TTPB684]|uniref:hypothetical protein n=1 Tax=unclassified Demequina TaxID=2620311 RepID=UPI001CF240B9|nr:MULTISPECIES: hypothetical protein [unclassified Demequina]MCB2412376.1 hypothetical protein [Demequina sp. TTPB684]UPU89046.1 hypothetical protein LGT36_003730 [Demequina sp. TMPB413]
MTRHARDLSDFFVAAHAAKGSYRFAANSVNAAFGAIWAEVSRPLRRLLEAVVGRG